MKKENEYWIDENGNKWNCDLYTKDQAIKFSESLIDCKNCIDCSDCISCIYCISCRSCSYCRYCSDCISCISCISCSDCREFNSNPMRLVSLKIGSRNEQIYIYWNEKKETNVVCGCYTGTLDEFENRVKKVHKDNKVYFDQYMRFIDVAKLVIEKI